METENVFAIICPFNHQSMICVSLSNYFWVIYYLFLQTKLILKKAHNINYSDYYDIVSGLSQLPLCSRGSKTYAFDLSSIFEWKQWRERGKKKEERACFLGNGVIIGGDSRPFGDRVSSKQDNYREKCAEKYVIFVYRLIYNMFANVSNVELYRKKVI